MGESRGYWWKIEPYWEAVSIYDGPIVFRAGFDAIPAAAQHLFAAHWLQSEVCNGGFTQFFANSTGVLAPQAEVAFRALGMPETAALVARAMRWFGPVYPLDRKARNDQLDAFDDDKDSEIESVDERFFELWDAEAGGFDEAASRFAEVHS